MNKVIEGVVHGRTIELMDDPGVGEGQRVQVVLSVASSNSLPWLENAPDAADASARPAQVGWTDEKNARRCQLIDKKIQASLTDAESSELDRLQSDMRRYVNQVAPLPFDAARRLHAELVRKQPSPE